MPHRLPSRSPRPPPPPPMYDRCSILIDPNHRSSTRGVTDRGSPSACASIRIPSMVPVPLPLDHPRNRAQSRTINAARITRCWDGPLGAVKRWRRRLIDRRSARRARHRMLTADHHQPLRHQHPAPSDHAVPSAAPAASRLHRPSRRRPRCQRTRRMRRGWPSPSYTGQRQIAFPDRSDCTRQMQRHQRRQARRVHRHRRTLQPQHRHPPGPRSVRPVNPAQPSSSPDSWPHSRHG